MNKKEQKKLRSQFEYECYLRDKPYYIMMKCGFYMAMIFIIITYVYGITCLCMEFFWHMIIADEFIMLILLSMIFISVILYTIGDILFEIEFRKQLKN